MIIGFAVGFGGALWDFIIGDVDQQAEVKLLILLLT